jgi:hypothetical protein
MRRAIACVGLIGIILMIAAPANALRPDRFQPGPKPRFHGRRRLLPRRPDLAHNGTLGVALRGQWHHNADLA